MALPTSKSLSKLEAVNVVEVQVGPNTLKDSAKALRWKTAIVVSTASVVLLFFYGLWLAKVAALVVFAGLLAALALSSMCRFLELRTNLRRRWSLPIVLFVVIGILSSAVWLRGPAIEEQIGRLQASLPQAAKAFVAQVQSHEWGRWLLTHGFGTEVPRIVDILPKLTDVVSGTLGLLGSLLIVLFLGIVIAAEPHTYIRGFENLFPATVQSYVEEVIAKVTRTLRWWLVARLASMLAVGIMVSLGLWALRVPMAGTLGLLAALLTFIPNIGPVLSAIPPILLAFTVSPRHALFVLLLFSAVHAAEGLLVTPVADRTIVRLPPGLTLFAQLVLAFLAGAVGVALAAPLTIVSIELVRTVYRDKVLGN